MAEGGEAWEGGGECRLSVSSSASSSSSSRVSSSSSSSSSCSSTALWVSLAAWWQSTRSTRSSFSRQVSVGMLRSSRYWRRSLTRSCMRRGRWKAVPRSRWQVVQQRRFSASTEHSAQKLFLQSQQMCCETDQTSHQPVCHFSLHKLILSKCLNRSDRSALRS